MADHVIKQLRDAVITRVTGLATTGTRVHSYRVNPLESIGDLPALIVRTVSDEAVESTVHSPAQYERIVDVTVMAYAAANADLDDTLDVIRKEVETALGNPLLLGGVAIDVQYRGSDFDLTDGERAAGELQMRFQATIFNVANTPDVFN